MKKRNIILLIMLLFIILGVLIYFSVKKDNSITNNGLPDDNYETAQLDKLKNILEESEYFKESKYDFNKDTNVLSIDEKYDVYIKNGYYLMNIKDSKDEIVYCNIVDAVEMYFGLEKGKSIDTCKETLKGSINLGGINVEFFDTYKVLTVNSNELSSIYSNENSHKEREFIDIDEINYDIKIDDYLFTSMSFGFSNNVSLYSICGHIYNEKKNDKNFIISIYDNSKNLIDEKVYNFTTKTGRFETFCVDFDIEVDTVRYYSVRFE